MRQDVTSGRHGGARSGCSLAELGRRAGRGDAAALNQLLCEVQDTVHRYLASRLSASADADDVAGDLRQEVLIRAAGAVARCTFESDRRVVAWVLAIARNVLVDYLRAERGRGDVVTRGELEPLAQNAALARWLRPAEDAAAGALLEEMTAKALCGLPEPTRDLVRLRVQLGLSWKEVGAALGTTESGAKRRFQRSQASLRTRFLSLLDALPPAPRDALLRRLKLCTPRTPR
jgi:RNA polymerase sigma-70 factor (ECF subfamily)